MHIRAKEMVAIIGHNGAGKSTLLKAAFGVIPIQGGQLLLEGVVLGTVTPTLLRRAGVCYVPQGNHVFTPLTVRENLELGSASLVERTAAGDSIDRSVAMFPALKPRLRDLAGNLSGGERQMLALAMALVCSPRLVLLDEPSLGLAPPLFTDVLLQMQEAMRTTGTAFLVVEQKVRQIVAVADRVYVLRNGSISFQGDAASLRVDDTLRTVYL